MYPFAGGTARVFSGSYQGNAVAVKMLFCVEFTEEIIRNYTRESNIMFKLRHPNIIDLFGICVVPPIISLVMERASGNLNELLTKCRVEDIDDETMLFFSIDCASAVAYLHQLASPIVHMDLKSSNFLVCEYTVGRWTKGEIVKWLVSEHLEEFESCFKDASELCKWTTAVRA
jgi:serine/threonine protein kinase